MTTNPHHHGQYELQQRFEDEAGHETWKAFATQQRRYVTIKIIHANAQNATPEVVQRFQREAQKLMSLQHANIAQMGDFLVVQTPDAATTDFWIVTDYVEGISLAEYIHTVTQQGTVPPPVEVVRFLVSVGSAIDYAHQRGVVHGNLNPMNILLDKYGTTSNLLGEPRLIGFGTYGLQQPIELPPSEAAYISPEVARAQTAVPQSDIYSLGVILYQICTGFLPFQGESSSDIVRQHIHATPAAPATLNQYIPAALTAVIMRSLAKDPVTRFPTAKAMVTALAQALNLALPERINRSHSQPGLADNPTFRTPSAIPGATPLPPVITRNTGSTPHVTATSSPAHTPFNVPSEPGIPASNTPFPPYTAYPTQSAGVTPSPANISGVWPAGGVSHAQPFPPTQAASPVFPSAPPVRKQSKRRLYILIGSLVALVVVLGGILATFLLLNRPSKTIVQQNPSVGHAFFVSSGQISVSSSVGIADQLQISLQNLQPPPAGKEYHVWLLSDSKTQALPIALGQLSVRNGQAVMTYPGDSHHSSILASYNRFLVTEEDAGTTPLNYTLDKNAWIFGSVISETPNPADTANHYSLLDHTRHLLAQDPKLKAAGLVGGLDIWLFRNTQKILEWAGSARDASDPAFMQRQIIRILDYLDGSQFVGTEKLPAGLAPIEVDPTIARVALLEIDPTQNPPGYLTHIGNHLREITHVPGVSPEQQALAIRITAAINNVQVWLQAVHTDAEKLIQMPLNQLLQPTALTLFNDMFTQANNAFIGQTDPNTLQIKEGVAEIHYNIQRLATFDVTSCTANKTACP